MLSVGVDVEVYYDYDNSLMKQIADVTTGCCQFQFYTLKYRIRATVTGGESSIMGAKPIQFGMYLPHRAPSLSMIRYRAVRMLLIFTLRSVCGNWHCTARFRCSRRSALTIACT